jgi:uncharacterized FlaG/YvyC family protein
MSKRDDAYLPFENIKSRLEEVAESLGLTIERISFSLDDNVESHTVTVIWSVRPDAVMTEAEKEQRKVDEQFKALTTSFDDPMQARAEEVKNSLNDFLNKFGDGV